MSKQTYIAFKVVLEDDSHAAGLLKHIRELKGVIDVSTYGEWVDFESMTDTSESSIERFNRKTREGL